MSIVEIPKLTMQQQVDTSQALLELDDMERAGLVEGFGGVDRAKCLRFLARAKRRGYTPSDNHYAIGKSFLEYVGGRFVDKPN